MHYHAPVYTQNEAGVYLLHTPCLSYHLFGTSRGLYQTYQDFLALLREGVFPNLRLQYFVNEYGVEALDFTVLFCCQPADLPTWGTLTETAYQAHPGNCVEQATPDKRLRQRRVPPLLY
jgi:hypothetical protein